MALGDGVVSSPSRTIQFTAATRRLMDEAGVCFRRTDRILQEAQSVHQKRQRQLQERLREEDQILEGLGQKIRVLEDSDQSIFSRIIKNIEKTTQIVFTICASFYKLIENLFYFLLVFGGLILVVVLLK
ncbi:MAG: hypothetical protein WC371_03190 [Parachlamydiales bacterium]|jgi:hypothetical protein